MYTYQLLPTFRRWLPFVIIVLSVTCALPWVGGPEAIKQTPQPISPPTATALPPTPLPRADLPPALVEIDPYVGSEIPLQGKITLYFNQPMQRASVEAALSSQPGIAGRFAWQDDATLTFIPDAPLPQETDVTISLAETAQAANGKQLLSPITLSFHTVGPLRLAQALPKSDSTDIDPSSAVVAAFNRPVVPLGADPASLPPAFTVMPSDLGPSAQGKGEWVNTSTYIFYPDPPLFGGITYLVNLNPKLQGQDGSPLAAENTHWVFTTAPTRIVSVQPSLETPLPLDADFIITFNQPMVPTSTANHFFLTQQGNPVAGKVTWNDDFTALTFTPTELLRRQSDYVLRLDGAAQAAGGTPLGNSYEALVGTTSGLMVSSTTPAQNGEMQRYPPVTIFLNNPVKEKNLLDFIKIIPEVSNLSAKWDKNEKAINVYGDFAYQTNYTLTISPDLTDIWGSRLSTAYSLDFYTKPHSPTLTMLSGYSDLFLPSDATGIPAQATNIYNVTVSLGNIPPSEFFRLENAADTNTMRVYTPPNQRNISTSFSLPPNRNQRISIPISTNGRPLSPGLYFARLFSTGVQQELYPFMMVVSDVHLVFKFNASEALVWATRLKDQSPVANTPITIFKPDGQPLASGQTDEQGLFHTTYPQLLEEDPYLAYFAMLSQPGQDDFSLVLSNWGPEYSYRGVYTPSRMKVYLYTDRPIYRPGQTIYFRAAIRQVSAEHYTLPDVSTLSATLYDGMRQELKRFDLPLSSFSTAHGEYTLPENATPGNYTLETEDESIYITVAEYRKSEINLSVDFGADEVLSGQSVSATVKAHYFFDAPASKTSVEWSLYEDNAYFSLPGYQVGPQSYLWMESDPYDNMGELLVDTGKGETDDNGSFVLELPDTAVEQAKHYRLEVTSVDESGLPVSAKASLTIHPEAFYIGVRPELWVAQAGSPAGFDVLTADWQRNPVGPEALSAKFEKVVWVPKETPDNEPYTGYTPKYTTIDVSNFSTDAQGKARIAFIPPDPGTYQLTISGGKARTEVLLWVGGPGRAVWPDLPNQRLRLTVSPPPARDTADEDVFLPGDVANIFIPNPFGEATSALLTMERNSILYYRMLTLDADGLEVSLPLGEADTPNVYVTVTLLGGNSHRHDFRYGQVELQVKPVQEILKVELTAQPERTSPGNEVTFKVKVTDSDGKPVQGEFSLSVVDLATLALADPNAPDIINAFYNRQPLKVNTGLSLAAYSGRYYSPPGGKGGGGGEAGALLREKFPDTAYWNASLVTDEYGTAQVNLALPDNLTTWQVDLRGLTIDTRVGQAQTQVVTTKDLLVRPVTPRFMVAGDHVQLAAIIQNNTPGELSAVDVSVQAKGFTLDDPNRATQRIAVPANGRAKVTWWGSVQPDGDSESDLIFTAQAVGATELKDVTRPVWGILPILSYEAPQVFITSGTLYEGGQRLEVISLPAHQAGVTTSPRGELRLELAPSLAAAMVNALDYLEHYPYECTEQTLSRFLPNLETYRALQTLGIKLPALQTRLDRTLSTGLSRLMAAQNEDGGWGWWSAGTSSATTASDPYITAYVLFGLSRASQAGISVNKVAFQKAVDFLENTIALPAGISAGDQTWQLDRLTFEYFALSQSGLQTINTLQGGMDLYNRRDQLNPWAKALLALALAGKEQAGNNEQVRNLLSDLQATALLSASGAHWEETKPGRQNMGTPVLTSAVVIYALAQLDPAFTLLDDATRYLMAHRRASGGWSSTYETAWTVLALTEVMKGTGELGGDFDFAANLNNVKIAEGVAGGAEFHLTPVITTLPVGINANPPFYARAPNALEIQRSSGAGRLYYTAQLNVLQPVEAASPLNRSLTISRAYYPAPIAKKQTGTSSPSGQVPNGGITRAAIQSAQAGQLVNVTVTLTVPYDAYYLLVEDHIPAGAEILDTSLKTTRPGAVDLSDIYDPHHPFANGWGWWYFGSSMIYDDHIAWSADYLPAGTYELAYTLALLQPGEYRVLPARAFQFYFPDVQGNSAGEIFTIEAQGE